MGPQPKVILIVVPSLSGGGAQRAAAWLSEAWSRDYRVVTAVFDAGDATYMPGGEVIDLRAGASRGFLRKAGTAIHRLFLLHRLIRDIKPDRMFGFMESANMPLLLAALASGMRLRTVVSVRCNPAYMPWFHKWSARLLYPLAAEVAVVSQGAAGGLLRELSLRAPLVRVRYSPLPLEAIRALANRSLPPSLAPAPAGPYFFSAGRLVPGKDFVGMIRIFAGLKRRDLRLVIAGEGPEHSRLEALIKAEGLTDHVVLAGRLENPFALMKNAIAFVLTSRHEGFPMVLLEAMACGCPIVAFDCDFGPAEAIAQTGAGYVVPMGDEAAFAEALNELAADPLLRKRMGEAAAIRAADFEASKIAADWMRR